MDTFKSLSISYAFLALELLVLVVVVVVVFSTLCNGGGGKRARGGGKGASSVAVVVLFMMFLLTHLYLLIMREIQNDVKQKREKIFEFFGKKNSTVV